MLEIILGAVIAIIIAHIYYRRSTRDLQQEVCNLQKEINNVKNLAQDIQNCTDELLKYSEIIKGQVIAGTPKDPGYPFK